jgi:AraC family transcriptional regulator of arabinose operon
MGIMMINNKYVFPLISNYDKQLPLYVVTVGSEIIINTNEKTKTRTIRPDGIPDHQFLFTAEGSASVIFNGKKYIAGPNSIIYHAPNTPHRYEGISDSWTSYWLTFAMHNNFSLFELKNGVYDLHDISPFINIITRMIALKNNFQFGEESSALLYKMILKLKRSLSDNATNNIHSLLKPSVEYLHENFAKELDLKTLADITGVTQGYYCKIFKDCYHIRPFEYIQQLRIQRAKSLLFSSPELPVAQIGTMVGYQSPSYFIKQFRKQESITPFEFRKRHNALF